MASGYPAQFTAATTVAFVQRLQEASVNAAVQIYNEAQTVAGHAARAAFAHSVLIRPSDYVQSFAYAIASTAGGSIDNTSTDAQIDVAIASVWNALAGA